MGFGRRHGFRYGIDEASSPVVLTPWPAGACFFDEFDDNAVGLAVDAGSGTVTEPVGTELLLTCADGFNCDWWSGVVENAPVAYRTLSPPAPGRAGLWQIVCRHSEYVAVQNNAHAGITIWTDRDNAWLFGWNESTGSPGVITVARILNDSGATISNSGSVPRPIAAAEHRYRVTWNNSGKDLYYEDPEGNPILLNSDRIKFEYSVNDGATWATLTEQDIQFVPERFGLFHKKWTSSGTNIAKFDWLLCNEALVARAVELTKNPVRVTEGGGGAEGDSLDPPVKGYLENAAGPVDVGGPPSHQTGVGAGQRVPGPVTQQTGSVGPFDKGLLENRASEQITADAARLVDALLQTKNPQPKGLLENEADHFRSVDTDLRLDTLDGWGHNHLTGERVLSGFIYDSVGEKWDTPTDPAFSGYGKDGHEYILGVQQPAGPHAPWALEGSSVDRSGRVDFPDKVLVVVARTGNSTLGSGTKNKEIVLFDLDAWPTISMWMRFKNNTGTSAFFMVGNEDRVHQKAIMVNGILAVVTTSSAGVLFLVNFKELLQDCGHFIGNTFHYQVGVGKTIADRNADMLWTPTGVSPSLRVDSESLYDVAGRADDFVTWIAVGGEDPGPRVFKVGTIPLLSHKATGDIGAVNISGGVRGPRNVLFDESGWLWVTVANKLFRAFTLYESGLIHLENAVVFPGDISCLAQARDYVYAGTEFGVYAIHRGTLQQYLAYTVVGGGGGGRLNLPPAGELLAGTNSQVYNIHAFSLHIASYLAVASRHGRGGVTLIRVFDDVVLDSKVYNSLHEPGAWFNVTLLR